ncbi:MAG: DUF2723 domain-containing protein [candidate division WOR-3 bacterium]|nr:DUF2723 domain-containing protein [candidate division WOR-3 bacterium]
MTDRRLKLVLFLAVMAIVLGYYAYASAPTASFWDCSEFIATGYTLGIPHPPSTPLFVQLARLVSFLPFRHEIAGRITLISSMFGSVCCGLIYLLVVYLVGLQSAPRRKETPGASGMTNDQLPMTNQRGNDQAPMAGAPRRWTFRHWGLTGHWSLRLGHSDQRIDWIPHLSGVVAALLCAFAYSFMYNTVEAIIFTPAATIAVAVTFLAVLWYIKEGKHQGDNRMVVACIYILVLATGVHFTPMIIFFALIPFFLMVDRRSVIDLRLVELFGFYVIILTVGVVPGFLAKVVWGLVLTAVFYFGMKTLEGAEKDRQVWVAMLVFVGMFMLAYFAGATTEGSSEGARNLVMDNLVLFLASPIAGLLDRMFANLPLFLLLAVGYGVYLYYLHTKKKLDAKYALLGLTLFLVAGTVQFFLLIRSGLHPHINEVDPNHWQAFASSLRREQYNAMRLFPRQTQYLLESDYQNYRNAPPNYGLLAGYFEQLKYYLRYFLWQWAGRFNLDFFVTSKTVFLQPLKLFPALVGLIPPLLGIWGIRDQLRRDRKTAALFTAAFLIASLGLLTYLNNKFSSSDPRAALVRQTYHQPMYLEVRERDYFYAFSFIFYTILVGIGLNAFLYWLRQKTRVWFRGEVGKSQVEMTKSGLRHFPFPLSSFVMYGTGLLAALLPFLVMSFNLPVVSRHGNWIPAEYGYNVLASCDNGGVIFTNGDNDTFPFWMIQEVPSAVSDSAARAERALPDYPRKLIPKTLEPITYGFRAQVAKGWGVAVANLSLLNTDWYCRQLKEWGAPVSLSNEVIERLSKGGLASQDNTRHYNLGDVMIRDMLATNTGITLKWPEDYTVSPDQFRARVFRNYHPRIPTYFATTVEPSSMEDAKGHLLQKGLALLVVGQEIPEGQELDGPASEEIFFHRLRLKSTLDPRVVKDENAVGLLGTYAKTFLDIAQYAARNNDTASCVKASDEVVRLGLDPERRIQVLFLTSKNLADVGVVGKAQLYLDSASKIVKQDRSTRGAITWTQAAIYRAAGKYAAAESLYLTLIPVAPELYWELSEMYRTGLKDNARAEAALESWYGKVAQDWPNTVRYIDALLSRFGDKARARQVLDAWAKKNPKDSAEAAALRRTI